MNSLKEVSNLYEALEGARSFDDLYDSVKRIAHSPYLKDFLRTRNEKIIIRHMDLGTHQYFECLTGDGWQTVRIEAGERYSTTYSGSDLDRRVAATSQQIGTVARIRVGLARLLFQ